jgi:hypothetical protein
LKSNKFNAKFSPPQLRRSKTNVIHGVAHFSCGPMWIHAKIKNLCRVLQIRLKSNKFNAKFSPPQLRHSKTNVIHGAAHFMWTDVDSRKNQESL